MESSNIKNLLRKHGYEVSVSGTKSLPNKIKASFPERKEMPVCDKFSGSYMCCPEESPPGIKLKVHKNEQFLSCPEYAMEELIFCNIDILCGLIGYNKNLIALYVDGQEVERSEFSKSVISVGLSQEDMSKKNALLKLVKQAKEEKFDPKFCYLSKEKGVDEGYQAIKTMYNIGEYDAI